VSGLAPVTRTGYIGIGTMGAPIAANAMAAGSHTVRCLPGAHYFVDGRNAEVVKLLASRAHVEHMVKCPGAVVWR
jgi:3-hydroxyisobutyrate dehydrogenase-like beta-hydroxyacid dehydrogenase